ncbi:MAG: hypothetical protein ACTSVO_01015 [Candidatus Heimdallarchaeaceae archaeon]
MPRDFKIFHSENVPDDIVDQVEMLLKDIYGIAFRIVGVRIPRQNCWDDSKHAFDVKALLNNMNNDGTTFFTWLLEKPLMLNKENVYGYGEPIKGALVTISKLATKTLIAKEVAFHVGTVLGLKNCSNECLMNVSENFERLIHKPSMLCKMCQIKFQRLKIRYM